MHWDVLPCVGDACGSFARLCVFVVCIFTFVLTCVFFLIFYVFVDVISYQSIIFTFTSNPFMNFHMMEVCLHK